MKDLIFTTDSELAAVVNMMLAGEKFFNEIDLDDDNQTAAVMAEMEELAREL